MGTRSKLASGFAVSGLGNGSTDGGGDHSTEVRVPKALYSLGGEVSPHPSRRVRVVLARSAKWRDPNCALPPLDEITWSERRDAGVRCGFARANYGSSRWRVATDLMRTAIPLRRRITQAERTGDPRTGDPRTGDTAIGGPETLHESAATDDIYNDGCEART